MSVSKWEPRFMAVGGTVAHHKLNDDVGMIGKNAIFRGAPMLEKVLKTVLEKVLGLLEFK